MNKLFAVTTALQAHRSIEVTLERAAFIVTVATTDSSFDAAQKVLADHPIATTRDELTRVAYITALQHEIIK
jgi:hypothetical protein